MFLNICQPHEIVVLVLFLLHGFTQSPCW